ARFNFVWPTPNPITGLPVTNPPWLGQPRVGPNLNTVSNEIWSVAIDGASGALLPATARREISMPALALAGPPVSSPVSDITFGPAGEMIVAERSMLRDAGCGQIPRHTFNPNDAHYSRTIEFTGSTGAWTQQPINKWRVGAISSGANAAGGVDMDCNGNLWATGDALSLPFPYIYGMQRSPAGGTAAASPATITSYLIDADHDISAHDKTQIGDVSVRDDDCVCARITQLSLNCEASLSFTIENRSGLDADHLRLVPVSPGGLVITPGIIPGLLPDGSGTSVKVNVSGYAPGDTVCFTIQLEDPADNVLCSVSTCTLAPYCGCMQVADVFVDWFTEGQQVKYFLSFTVTNFSNEPAGQIEPVAAAPVTFSPAIIPLSPPLAPGASRGVSTIICNAAPGAALYMPLRLQRTDGTTICESDMQVQLPWCDVPDPPDTCSTTPVATCCPPMDIFAPPEATIVATICNNSSLPRTYNWSVAGLAAAPPCFNTLFPSDFSPSSGSVGPVAPGACASVTITVNCLTFGELPPLFGCARYRVTFADTGSPTILTCDGRVQSSQWNFKDITSCCPSGGVNGINLGSSASGIIVVSTTNPMGGDLPFRLETGIQQDGPDHLALSINGMPASQGYADTVHVDPGGEGVIEFEVSFDYEAPNLVDHVYVIADVDGDGREDIAGSASFQQLAPLPCPGDTNGDGQVNFDDLNEVLAQWATMVKPGSGADVNGDGFVDFSDLNEVLANWGAAC
ncbi:MAG: hypothetical protein KDA21_07655, partial [Phycisphaerales bacterium]|nr:hypothetical protein [Phycisphaerales bacterium]